MTPPPGNPPGISSLHAATASPDQLPKLPFVFGAVPGGKVPPVVADPPVVPGVPVGATGAVVGGVAGAPVGKGAGGRVGDDGEGRGAGVGSII